MSLRLAIPWRVALQQSPPPLRQPRTIVAKVRLFKGVEIIERRSVTMQFVSTEGVTPIPSVLSASLSPCLDLGRIEAPDRYFWMVPYEIFLVPPRSTSL